MRHGFSKESRDFRQQKNKVKREEVNLSSLILYIESEKGDSQ